MAELGQLEEEEEEAEQTFGYHSPKWSQKTIAVADVEDLGVLVNGRYVYILRPNLRLL